MQSPPAPHIFVCTSTLPAEVRPSCGAFSSSRILDQLPFILAKLGLSDVQVTSCGCLGACGGGANLVIYPEGVFYRHVTLDNIEELVEQHFIARRPIAKLVVAS